MSEKRSLLNTYDIVYDNNMIIDYDFLLINSDYFFRYTLPTFISGFKRDLNESDLTDTLNEHKSSYLGDKMEKFWKEEEEKAFRKKQRPSLQKVLIKAFGLEFLMYGMVLAFSEAIRFEIVLIESLYTLSIKYLEFKISKAPVFKDYFLRLVGSTVIVTCHFCQSTSRVFCDFYHG